MALFFKKLNSLPANMWPSISFLSSAFSSPIPNPFFRSTFPFSLFPFPPFYFPPIAGVHGVGNEEKACNTEGWEMGISTPFKWPCSSFIKRMTLPGTQRHAPSPHPQLVLVKPGWPKSNHCQAGHHVQHSLELLILSQLSLLYRRLVYI